MLSRDSSDWMGTERNNNFIFHSGHTTPASLWDLNKLNTNKFVNIVYVLRQFYLLSFFCNVDPSSWWWQPIVTMVLVKVIIIHHSPTKECILVHWSNIMPTNDPSSFYNWCFRIKTFFDWIRLLCVSYIVSLLPTWREFSFVISNNVNIYPELENIFKYHFPLRTLHGQRTDSECKINSSTIKPTQQLTVII